MPIDYAAILARKIKALFPDDEARAEAVSILATYGVESYEREVPRVRLAVLKLAGVSFSELRRHVEVAKRDYRDALAAAEYPAQGAVSESDIDRVLAAYGDEEHERAAARSRPRATSNTPSRPTAEEKRRRPMAEDSRAYAKWLEE